MLSFDVTNVVFRAILLSLYCQGTTLGDGCVAADPSVLTSFLGGRDFEDLASPTVLKKYLMSVSHSSQPYWVFSRKEIILQQCKTYQNCFSSLGLYFTRKMPGCMHLIINSRSTIDLNLSMAQTYSSS